MKNIVDGIPVGFSSAWSNIQVNGTNKLSVSSFVSVVLPFSSSLRLLLPLLLYLALLDAKEK